MPHSQPSRLLPNKTATNRNELDGTRSQRASRFSLSACYPPFATCSGLRNDLASSQRKMARTTGHVIRGHDQSALPCFGCLKKLEQGDTLIVFAGCRGWHHRLVLHSVPRRGQFPAPVQARQTGWAAAVCAISSPCSNWVTKYISPGASAVSALMSSTHFLGNWNVAGLLVGSQLVAELGREDLLVIARLGLSW